MSMVDRIMLKFRPIAPKPVGSGSGNYGGSMTENGGQSRRRKRRYVRVNSNNKNKIDKNRCSISSSSTVSKKRKALTTSFHPAEAVSGGGDAVETLSLMPERPDRKEDQSPVFCSPIEYFKDFKNNMLPSPVPAKRQQTVSCVTVECVTETWVGCRDEETVIKGLECDTCPGFISDGGERMVWMNQAYREMAGGEGVMVVGKECDWPAAAFTCKVKVTCRSGMSSLMVPCDVWRMSGGGYAWRLDVKAALCLGR